MASIDLDALAGMNNSATVFYAGMNERTARLSDAAESVHCHAGDAQRVARDMKLILQKALRLEALVDKLDEYSQRQEAELSYKRR